MLIYGRDCDEKTRLYISQITVVLSANSFSRQLHWHLSKLASISTENLSCKIS